MALADIEATYNTTLADVNKQATWEESGLGEREANLKGNVGYQESERERAEPGAYREDDNRANRGGLLTSGTEARRHGDIEANFGARKTANQLQLTEGLGSIKHGREGVTAEKEKGEHGAQSQRQREIDAYNAEHPPAPPAAPAAPKPPATFGAPAGGAVPQATFTPDPNYPIGPNPNEPYPGYQAIRSGRVKTGKPAEPYPGYYARAYGRVK